MMLRLTLLLLALITGFVAHAHDARYCGPPQRSAAGDIIRSRAPLRDFQRIHPCPSTGLSTGACPGWHKDHVIPLVCGGCDTVENLQWLPVEIKACAGTDCKDRWERRVYCQYQGAQP